MWQTDRQTDGRTDGRTDRRTDWTIHRAAWSQLKTIRHLFFTTLSFVHHFKAMHELKCDLQSGNAQFGSKSEIFCPVWSWYLTDDLEKQYGTSPEQHQVLCIISSPFVNSNWSHGPDTAKWGHDLCDLDLWPALWPFVRPSLLSMVITPENFVMKGWQEHGEKSVTDRHADGRTDWSVLRAAWSQLKIICSYYKFF